MKTLIGISGKMRSGKNTIGEYLAKLYGWSGRSTKLVSFAGPLKEACKSDYSRLQEYMNEFVFKFREKIKMLGLPPTYHMLVEKNLEGSLRELEINDENWYENKTPITRILIQDYGTKIFRERVGSNYWTSKFIEEVNNSVEDVIICTDVRFINEAEAIKNSGLNNILIRVNKNLPITALSNAASETDLDNYTSWDVVFDNNSSVEDLYKKVEQFYEKLSG